MDALVDTGCNKRNFISPRIAKWLMEAGAPVERSSGRVCTAFGACKDLSDTFSNIAMHFHDNINNNDSSIVLTADTLDMKKIDMVIGLPTILLHQLASRMLEARHRATGDDNPTSDESVIHPEVAPSPTVNSQRDNGSTDASQPIRTVTTEDGVQTKEVVPLTNIIKPSLKQASRNPGRKKGSVPLTRPCELCALQVDKSKFLDSEPEAEEIPEPHTLELSDLVPQVDSSGAKIGIVLPAPEQIHGPEPLRKAISELCVEFGDVFSTTVRKNAANVSPLALKMEKGKTWKIPASRRAARPQGPQKLAALKIMVDTLLELGVIRRSTQANASQVLLVSKKGTEKLRFCIDYRELNEITDSDSWPIPNIGQLLAQLGARKSKYFAVMDLTSGYHQTPLEEDSKKLTAFICAFGVFEWNRVPMGLKGAGSYFQRVMTTEILGDIIHELCEVYLDDVIVFGGCADTFLANLREVFVRYRAFGITLNPAKCHFGLEQIEYVGHLINEYGHTFTRSKLDSVVNFPKPKTHAHMKSFLGLANYFRAHIKNHSAVAKPLNDMVKNYKRQRILEWSEVEVAAFEKLKQLIDDCPILYFVDPKGQIVVQTDASNDGIGAYVFQLITLPDGSVIEQPIEFISKGFSKEQKRWSTPEQEAYAIFYTLRKLEYLLRDVKFILQTDHKNLIYMNENGSPKVRRWKLLLQEYDFLIEHIAGKDNVIADAFSRLCLLTEDEDEVDEDNHELDDGLTTEFLVTMELLDEADEFIQTEYQGPRRFKGIDQLWALDDCDAIEFMSLQMTTLPHAMYDKIQAVHNALAGHKGVKATVARLKKLGEVDSDLIAQVRKFIRECPLCQKLSHKKNKVATLPFTLAKYNTMAQLFIDSIGPLKADKEGYQHILVVIDAFTRWVMLYPLKTLEAIEAAQALIQHFGIFGVPADIKTDGGSQFGNETINQIIELVGAQHSISLAYSHQEMGIVERSNKETMRHLRAFMFEKGLGTAWRLYTPFVQRILNAEVVQSIGVAPARILFGEAVDLDRGIFTPNVIAETHDHGDLTQFVNDLMQTQRAVIQFAAKAQKAKDAEHKISATAAMAGEPTQFKQGTNVLLEYPSGSFTKPRPPHKLMTQKRGPLEVVTNKGPEYTLQDIVTGRQTKAHVARISEFYFDKTRIDPLSVAARDTDHEIVEAVLDHRGYSGKKGDLRQNLQLQIKWLNQEEPSWHPWKDFHNNILAHSYMIKIPYLERILSDQWRIEKITTAAAALDAPAAAAGGGPVRAVPAPPVKAKKAQRIVDPAPVVIADGDQAIPETRHQKRKRVSFEESVK